MDWKVVGPFPKPKPQQADPVYPPETADNLSAEFAGINGKVRWQNCVSTSDAGIVDLNTVLPKVDEAVGYARAEFTSDKEQTAEIRLGCYNGFKLWINGELVLVRGDEFTGMDFDHYTTPVHLKQGKNVFLLKLYKSAAPPPVPSHWRFQLRVCDASGAAVLSANRPAPSRDKKS
jgi:hypothetical protein